MDQLPGVMLLFVVLLGSFLVGYGGATTITDEATNQTWSLVWQDEFNDDQLNTSNWHYNVETNDFVKKHKQLQYYTGNRTENVRLENGTLVIEARAEEFEGRNFTSGRLDSKHQWTFGRFETRARMPSGHHLWPAIWMMPRESFYGGWPSSGEIDLLEQRGDTPHIIETTLHYSNVNAVSTSGRKQFGTNDLSQEFHRYSFEWSPTSMKFFFDDHQFFAVNLNRSMWTGHGVNPYHKPGQPFDRPFYWILNIAIGGGFFGPGPYVTPEQAKYWKKKTMEFDYIRVYQLK